MEEWKTYKLSEIGNIVGGATPSTKIAENYDGDIPWITPKDLSDFSGRFIKYGERNITQQGFDSCSCQMLPKNSVLFSSRAPIGYVAIAAAPLCTNQGFKSVVPNEEIVDSRFLYYLLKFNKDRIAGMGSGTTFMEVSGGVMKNVEVSLPVIAIQKHIAEILSSIDDKIELNNRINHNLEDQAQALYKSYFVDFEPFKGGKFVDSELGMIPEGWRVAELGTVTRQNSQKVKDRIDVKVLSPVTTGELVLSEEYFTKQVFSESISKYLVVKPLHFAYNPARVNIGSIGMNMFSFDGCVSPVYVVFECEKGYHHFFDYYRKTESFKDEVLNRAIGGVRQTLSYKDFALIKLVYPPYDIVEKFNCIYAGLLENKNSIKREISKLSELRDTLLPKLLSGELKIDDFTC